MFQTDEGVEHRNIFRPLKFLVSLVRVVEGKKEIDQFIPLCVLSHAFTLPLGKFVSTCMLKKLANVAW